MITYCVIYLLLDQEGIVLGNGAFTYKTVIESSFTIFNDFQLCLDAKKNDVIEKVLYLDAKKNDVVEKILKDINLEVREKIESIKITSVTRD